MWQIFELKTSVCSSRIKYFIRQDTTLSVPALLYKALIHSFEYCNKNPEHQQNNAPLANVNITPVEQSPAAVRTSDGKGLRVLTYSGRVRIILPDHQGGSGPIVNIYTVDGEIVHEFNSVANRCLIWHTTDVARGIYVIQAEIGNRLYAGKLIVLR